MEKEDNPHSEKRPGSEPPSLASSQSGAPSGDLAADPALLRRTRRCLFWAMFVVFGGAMIAAVPLGRALLWHWESNPVLRGRLLAREQGCFNCHLPDGGKEIPNPGSRWGSVPKFQAGNWRMYAEDCREVREFIRYGAPRAWLDDPKVRDRLKKQRLRMPAYGKTLSDEEIEDLTAFACAKEGVFDGLEGLAAQGLQIARKQGCTSCHGLAGAGGRPNPDSIAGFIPGFAGKNFQDLVTSRAEFEEWVRTGSLKRLESNPVAAFFWERQRLSMPAYGPAVLTPEDLDKLWAWITWMRQDKKR